MSYRAGIALMVFCSACVRLQGPPEATGCNTDAECKSGQVCATDGQCHEQGYCKGDLDCHGDAQCEDSKCVSVQCTAALAQVCSPYRCTGTTCRTGCSDDSDCVEGHACVAGICIAAECSFNADCMGYRCENARCTESCAESYDCDVAFKCLAGECVPADAGSPDGSVCQFSEQCSSGTCCVLAAAASGHCTDQCGGLPSDYPCSWHEQCSSGNCVTGRCTACGPADCPQLGCAIGQCGNLGDLYCGDCGVGLVCVGSICQQQVCDPTRSVFCNVNTLTSCQDGTTLTEIMWCGESALCNEETSSCETYQCTPDYGFCKGSVYRRCDALGHHSGEPRDCHIDGLDCSVLGCGVVHIDEVPAGSPSETQDRNTCGNLFRVDFPVWLVSLSQSLDPGTAELRWFAYSSETPDGLYRNEIYGGWVSGGSPLRSPDLSVQLEQGRYYFIGAQVTGTGAQFDFAPELPNAPLLSFGERVDSFCLPNGLNESLSDREHPGVVLQGLETVVLDPG